MKRIQREGILDRIPAAWRVLTGKVPVPEDSLKFHGLIRVRELPFDNYEEYQRWWLPEMKDGQVIHMARMSDREKDRYTVVEAHNLITGAGRALILGYIASPTAGVSTPYFAAYFEVGNYPTPTVSAGDTLVQGGLARVAPSTAITTGTQLDIASFFGAATGVGTWTSAGLYGGPSASNTIGTGTLATHSLFSYPKTNSQPVTCDYLINLT